MCVGLHLWRHETRQLKLIDWSLSETVAPSGGQAAGPLSHSVYCTRNYRAPELYMGAPSEVDVTPGADLWSAGCVVFEAKTKGRLVEGETSSEVRINLKRLVKNGCVGLHSRCQLAGIFHKFIRKCMEHDPKQRAFV